MVTVETLKVLADVANLPKAKLHHKIFASWDPARRPPEDCYKCLN